MKMVGVSRATAPRALLTLENEGLIDRGQGRPTRVSYRRIALAGPQFERDIHRIEQIASATDVAVLDYAFVQPPESRIMNDKHGPVAHQWTSLPPGRCRLRTSIESVSGDDN